MNVRRTQARMALGLWILALAVTAADAQTRPQQPGTVRVTVKDPSGAVIPARPCSSPGLMTRRRRGAQRRSCPQVMSDGQGVAQASGLAPGRYRLDVTFPGFEPHVTPELRVRAGDNRREVTLAIRKIDESVAVGRDPQTSASDPKSDRFGNGAHAGTDRRAARRSRRDGDGAEGDGRAGRHDPRRRLPRRQAAAEVADPLDPVRQRHVRGREPRRRHDVRRHLDPAGPRTAARQRRRHVPRRRAERAECVPAGEGTRAEAAVHVQSERDPVEGTDVVLAVGWRRHPVRLGQHLRRHVVWPAHGHGAAAERPDRTSPAGSITRCRSRTRCARCSSRTATISRTSASAASTSTIAPSRGRRATACCGWPRADRWPAPGSASPGCRCDGRRPSRPPFLEAADGSRARRLHLGRRAAGRRPHRHRDRMGHQRRLGAWAARGAVRLAGRGRPLPQRQPHQLSRHLHVREPRRLSGRHRLDLHAGAMAIRWSTTRTGRPGSSCRTTGGRAGT